jgi:hypothetical protein
VKQLERKIDAKAISLDGINTTVAWRVRLRNLLLRLPLIG